MFWSGITPVRVGFNGGNVVLPKQYINQTGSLQKKYWDCEQLKIQIDNSTSRKRRNYLGISEYLFNEGCLSRNMVDIKFEYIRIVIKKYKNRTQVKQRYHQILRLCHLFQDSQRVGVMILCCGNWNIVPMIDGPNSTRDLIPHLYFCVLIHFKKSNNNNKE